MLRVGSSLMPFPKRLVRDDINTSSFAPWVVLIVRATGQPGARWQRVAAALLGKLLRCGWPRPLF